jgi:hypothetical protein
MEQLILEEEPKLPELLKITGLDLVEIQEVPVSEHQY